MDAGAGRTTVGRDQRFRAKARIAVGDCHRRIARGVASCDSAVAGFAAASWRGAIGSAGGQNYKKK